MANTNGAVGDIFLNLRVNQNLGQQIAGASNSTASAISSSVGGMFKKLIGAVAVGTAVKALKDIGSAAIETASDLAEAQNVVDVAFGEMAQDCEEFAKIAIEQFGISELAAKKTASTFMSMGKSMGVASADASKMAINVSKLSADVASFYNITQSEAATKLKGIYTGETEALKELGVVMTQTNLKQYALDKGIKTTYDDMDQAQKVSLRYKYVMEQLSLAQGDFSRTQSSWSNQTKILKENWTQFLTTVGQGLIKVLEPALQLLNDMVEVLNEFANTLSTKFGWKTAEEETEKSTQTMGSLIAENIGEGVEKAKKELLGLASFDEIISLSKKTDETSNGESFDIFGDEYEDQAKAEKKENTFKNMLNNVKDYFLEFWNQIKDPVMAVINPIFEAFSKGFNMAKEEFGIWAEFAVNLWETKIKPLIDKIKELFTNVFNIIIKPIMENLFSTISEWWDEHGREFFQTLITALYTVYETIVTVANFFVEHLGPIVADFVNLCVDTLFEALGVISDIITGILDIFIKLFEDITGAFDNAKESLTKGWNALFGEDEKSHNSERRGKRSSTAGDFIGRRTSNIPALASGGIVTQPTLAMIGEGSQSEAVLPLDDLRVMIAEVVAEVMAEFQAYNNENNQDLYLTLNFDGDRFLDKVVTGINRRTRNNNKEVILSY